MHNLRQTKEPSGAYAIGIAFLIGLFIIPAAAHFIAVFLA